MSRGRRLWALAALAAALTACGGQQPPTDLHTPGVKPHGAPGAGATGPPVTPAEIAVIRGWADRLRQGRVAGATRYFALPSIVDPNGNGPRLILRTRRQVLRFNRGLPCGARLTRWQRAPRRFVVATFALTDRPGHECDAPTGTPAAVAFLIRRGHIAQWLRVAVPGDTGGQTES